LALELNQVSKRSKDRASKASAPKKAVSLRPWQNENHPRDLLELVIERGDQKLDSSKRLDQNAENISQPLK